MKTRTTNNSDKDKIKQVYLDAFPDAENKLVANLAVDLLSEEFSPSCSPWLRKTTMASLHTSHSVQ